MERHTCRHQNVVKAEKKRVLPMKPSKNIFFCGGGILLVIGNGSRVDCPKVGGMELPRILRSRRVPAWFLESGHAGETGLYNLSPTAHQLHIQTCCWVPDNQPPPFCFHSTRQATKPGSLSAYLVGYLCFWWKGMTQASVTSIRHLEGWLEISCLENALPSAIEPWLFWVSLASRQAALVQGIICHVLEIHLYFTICIQLFTPTSPAKPPATSTRVFELLLDTVCPCLNMICV